MAYEAVHDIGAHINRIWIQMLDPVRKIDRFNTRHEWLLNEIQQSHGGANQLTICLQRVDEVIDLQHSIALTIQKCLQEAIKGSARGNRLQEECRAVEALDGWNIGTQHTRGYIQRILR